MMTFSRAGRGHLGVVLVGAVVVRRLGFELGCAGVDGLVGHLDPGVQARRSDRRLVEVPEVAELGVAEAHTLGTAPGTTIHRTDRRRAAAERLEVRPLLDDQEHLVQEPSVDARDLVDLLEGNAAPQQRLDLEDPLRCADRCPAEQFGGGDVVELDLRSVAVEAAAPLFQGPERLLQRLGEGTADRHDLAHGLHLGAEAGLDPGELLEGPPGHLRHHVVDASARSWPGSSW